MKRLLSMLLICLPFPGFTQSLDPLNTIESKVLQGMIDYTSRKPQWAREFDEVGYSEGVFICRQYIHTPNLYQNDTISYRRSFRTYLYSTEGKRLSSQPYDDIGAFTEGLAPVVIKKPLRDGNFVGINGKGRTGFINTKGEVVIPLMYTWISNFREGVAFVGDSLERAGFFIDRHNRVVFKEKFSPFITTQFHNGICLVVDRNHQPNYLTHQGELLIPRVFDFIEDIPDSRSLQVVAKDGKYGLLGANAQLQLPLTYDLIDTTRKNQWRGWYQTRRNHRYGYLDAETGVEIIKPVFEDLMPASFSSLWAKKNSQWGLLRANQQVAYPFRVDSIVSIKDGYTIIQEKQKKGIIDSLGRLIVPVSYDNVSVFHEGIALLIKNERIGYVTRQGRIIAEPEYLSGTYFRNRTARVKTRFMQYTIDEYNRKIEKNLTSLSYVIISSFITLLVFCCTLAYQQSRRKQVF